MNSYIRNHTYEILGKTTLIHDNIDFIKSIIIELAYETSIGRLSKIPIWKSILKMICPLKNHGFENMLTSNVIFSSYVNRKDYDELIMEIKRNISGSIYIRLLNVFKRQLSFPKKNYIKIFKAVWGMQLSLKAKFALSSILIDYMSSYLSLNSSVIHNNINLSKVCYIPLCSSVGLENILTQYINNNCGKTYHLCHGLHFAKNYRFFSVDAFNKELITAQTVLSWGQSFVDNDSFYHKHEIVGNPKYPAKDIQIEVNKNSAIVLLARRQYDDNNCKLLEVLADYVKINNTQFYVKPHPTSDYTRIHNLCDKFGFEICGNDTLKELFSKHKYGFAVSYETTSYFEAMYYNTICFRYALEENECYGEFDDRFTTADQLHQQLEKYITMPKEILNSKIKTVLQYEFGMGINRYKEVIGN